MANLEQLKIEFLNSPEFKKELPEAPKKPDFEKYMKKYAPDFDFNGFVEREYKTYPRPQLNEEEQIKAMKDRAFVNEHHQKFISTNDEEIQVHDPAQTQTIIQIQKISDIIYKFREVISKGEEIQDKAPEKYANMVLYELKKVCPEWITRTKESILSEIEQYNIYFMNNKVLQNDKAHKNWEFMVLEFSQVIEAYIPIIKAPEKKTELKAADFIKPQYYTEVMKDLRELSKKEKYKEIGEYISRNETKFVKFITGGKKSITNFVKIIIPQATKSRHISNTITGGYAKMKKC